MGKENDEVQSDEVGKAMYPRASGVNLFFFLQILSFFDFVTPP